MTVEQRCSCAPRPIHRLAGSRRDSPSRPPTSTPRFAEGPTDGPRDEWAEPPRHSRCVGDIRGKRIAHVAAGEGYLTKHVLRAVGAGGRVYAVEIGEKELVALRALAQRDSFANVQKLHREYRQRPSAPVQQCVVILNSYHELADYKSVLAAIKRRCGPAHPSCSSTTRRCAVGFSETIKRVIMQRDHPKVGSVAELTEAGFEIADRRDDFIVSPYAQWLL